MRWLKNFSIFEVKRKEPNLKRFLLTLILFVVIFFTPYVVVRNQQKHFERFEVEYLDLSAWLAERVANGEALPLDGEVDWKKEKKLSIFLNRFSIALGEAYYINLSEYDASNRKYIFLMSNQTLYTQKPVYYSMERWHTLLDRPVFSIKNLNQN